MDGDVYYIDEEDDNSTKDEPRNEQGRQHADQDEFDENTALLAHITKQRPLPVMHDIHKLLASMHRPRSSNNHQRKPAKDETKKIVHNGKRYVQTDLHKLQYRLDNSNTMTTKISSLVDGEQMEVLQVKTFGSLVRLLKLLTLPASMATIFKAYQSQWLQEF